MGLSKVSEEVEVLVELLKDVLGNDKQHYESKGQISFDCPVCAREKGLDKGDGKGNLEINYFQLFFAGSILLILLNILGILLIFL